MLPGFESRSVIRISHELQAVSGIRLWAVARQRDISADSGLSGVKGIEVARLVVSACGFSKTEWNVAPILGEKMVPRQFVG